jgi:hypothetical protein
VLNGSHTASEDGMANVLVLPDSKMVRVEESRVGAETLWDNALDPELRVAGKGAEHESKSYLLPYSCVILLCTPAFSIIASSNRRKYRLTQASR